MTSTETTNYVEPPATMALPEKEDDHVAVHEENMKAHGQSHSISPQSAMRHTTLRMTLLALFVGIGGFILNFDIGYTGNVLVMEPFNKVFGHCTTAPGSKVEKCSLSATQQSMGSSIYLLFLAAGSGLSGLVSNYLGPRGALQVGSFFTMIGAAGMVGSSGSFTAYVVCKCIGAIGLGHIQTMAATYGVDCAPSRKRGLLITIYAAGATIGNLVASCVCYSTQYFPTSWSWRTPIVSQIPIAMIFGLGLFMFPQSPRWLLSKDKPEKARKAFSQLYNRDPHSEDVSGQLRDVQLAIEEEKAMSSTTHWTEIFHRNFRRRTLVAMAINCCAPLSGSFFIFSYAALFLRDVGLNNPIEISIIINTCVAVGGILGPVFVEYLGRRRTIITGYIGGAICMLVFSATSTGLGGVSTGPARRVLIAFLCGWAFMFGGFISSTQFMASAEMHAVRHRNYGQAFVSMVGNALACCSSFWGPYMLNVKYGNMGTNVGYFYFGLQLISAGILFLVVPENARLTLEQVDEYFTSGRKPRKTSLARNKRIQRGEIGVNDD